MLTLKRQLRRADTTQSRVGSSTSANNNNDNDNNDNCNDINTDCVNADSDRFNLSIALVDASNSVYRSGDTITGKITISCHASNGPRMGIGITMVMLCCEVRGFKGTLRKAIGKSNSDKLWETRCVLNLEKGSEETRTSDQPSFVGWFRLTIPDDASPTLWISKNSYVDNYLKACVLTRKKLFSYHHSVKYPVLVMPLIDPKMFTDIPSRICSYSVKDPSTGMSLHCTVYNVCIITPYGIRLCICLRNPQLVEVNNVTVEIEEQRIIRRNSNSEIIMRASIPAFENSTKLFQEVNCRIGFPSSFHGGSYMAENVNVDFSFRVTASVSGTPSLDQRPMSTLKWKTHIIVCNSNIQHDDRCSYIPPDLIFQDVHLTDDHQQLVALHERENIQEEQRNHRTHFYPFQSQQTYRPGDMARYNTAVSKYQSRKTTI